MEEYHEQQTEYIPSDENLKTFADWWFNMRDHPAWVWRESQANFSEKTMLGINSERKRLTAKSPEAMFELTGIPVADLIGTPESEERVLIVGAPWQAKNMPDEERFTYLDYEFGEIAEFCRTTYDMLLRAGELIWDMSPHSWWNSIADNKVELDNHVNNVKEHGLSNYECHWYPRIAELSEKIGNHLITMSKQRDQLVFNTDTINKQNEIIELVDNLEQLIRERENIEPEIIAERKRMAQKSDIENAYGFRGDHPIEEIHMVAKRLINRIRQGFQDINDYKKIILPQLMSAADDDEAASEVGAYLTKIELDLLHELRFKKGTQKAHVERGLFPNLSFKPGSFDRIVCSYSISTHVISEMNRDDFRAWWVEFDKLLAPGGKAFIFPIQQGFPYGRTYDGQAFDDSLAEFSDRFEIDYAPEEYKGSVPDDYFSSDLTLVLTKNK